MVVLVAVSGSQMFERASRIAPVVRDVPMLVLVDHRLVRVLVELLLCHRPPPDRCVNCSGDRQYRGPTSYRARRGLEVERAENTLRLSADTVRADTEYFTGRCCVIREQDQAGSVDASSLSSSTNIEV